MMQFNKKRKQLQMSNIEVLLKLNPAISSQISRPIKMLFNPYVAKLLFENLLKIQF